MPVSHALQKSRDKEKDETGENSILSLNIYHYFEARVQQSFRQWPETPIQHILCWKCKLHYPVHAHHLQRRDSAITAHACYAT